MKRGLVVAALCMLIGGLNLLAQSDMQLTEVKITVTDENGNVYDNDKYVVNCDLIRADDEPEISLTGMNVWGDTWYATYIQNPNKAKKVKAKIWLSKAGEITNGVTTTSREPVDDIETKTIEIDLSNAKAGVAPKESKSKVKRYDANGKKIKLRRGTPIVPDEVTVTVTLAHKKQEA